MVVLDHEHAEAGVGEPVHAEVDGGKDHALEGASEGKHLVEY